MKTTWQAWDRYAASLKQHEEHYANTEPRRENYETEYEYDQAHSKWNMGLHMDAPNKPGYYRANND